MDLNTIRSLVPGAVESMYNSATEKLRELDPLKRQLSEELGLLVENMAAEVERRIHEETAMLRQRIIDEVARDQQSKQAQIDNLSHEINKYEQLKAATAPVDIIG